MLVRDVFDNNMPFAPISAGHRPCIDAPPFKAGSVTLGVNPLSTSQPTAHLFLQVHSANCNWFCGGADAELELRSKWWSGTAECVERNAARSLAWQALHLRLTF